MKVFILMALIWSSAANADLRKCSDFELTLNLRVLSKVYFIRTMTAQISVKKRKATLLWDSGFESKKWKIHPESGLILVKAKKLGEVFESYEDSTSNARYVQMMNFIEDHEDEDDFRFTPMNESAPFIGNDSYPNSVGEYKVTYSYSNCQE
ncbi:MAG: hypothetical protein CME70_12200 [Halobacteriovorax sp.]|nr:hypothetical protein [Halobacteriovorax sp.]|tara:strand:+ start:280462 stop:280914 length:453 start_codon:yes stop_codon:yes gene_type:complete